MGNILIVDDVALLRRPVAMALRAVGHETTEAASGFEALAMISSAIPDLLLLDLSMPRMSGIEVLRALRGKPETSRLPVICLTATADKEHVVEAAQLGVRDYVLKSAFSVTELLSRVHKYVAAVSSGNVEASALPAKQSASPPQKPAAAPKVVARPVTAMLDKDKCIRRIELAMQGRTLSGVIANVMAMATSPHSDMVELSNLIQHDSMLSARILQAANSAAYAARGTVMSIPDAIRRIGCATVRNIAASIGIFDAMPEDTSGGFNAIRCWTHSFATARLCEQLSSTVPEGERGLAYLIGLCHDLSEILLRTEFAVEYAEVLEACSNGMTLAQAEQAVLGTSRMVVMQTIHKCLALPHSIAKQIETFHAAPPGKRSSHPNAMVKVLNLAEQTANGMLLASSLDSIVSAFSPAECLSAKDVELLQSLDPEKWRGEIVSLTTMLGRLKPDDAQKLGAPLVADSHVPLLIVRSEGLAPIDPLQLALSAMSATTTIDHPPTDAELGACAGVVIVGADSKTSAIISKGFDHLAGGARGKPVMWLGNEQSVEVRTGTRIHQLPVSLGALAESISELAGAMKKAAA
jgi:CheY-like chemotaxis protein/HD-like signal output (HDOD) protein